jgi:hypothetical protein
MAQLTDQEIADLARRLANLLDDEDGRGMATWQIAREQVGRELYNALGAALGEPPMRGVQIGHGNIQTNTFLGDHEPAC